MKNKLFYTLFAAILLTLGFSCSSDDDANIQPENALIGTWQLTNIDFTRMVDGGFPASDACILELVSFYEFRADGKFYFLLTNTAPPIFDPYANDYWSWSGDKNNFIVTQTNPMSPPYNFSLQPTAVSVSEVSGEWIMKFSSELSNGSKAIFTLVKKPINLDLKPAVTDEDGNPYECNFFGG